MLGFGAAAASGDDGSKSDDQPAGPRELTPKAGDFLETEPVAFRLAVGGTRLRFGSQLAATRGQLITVPVLWSTAFDTEQVTLDVPVSAAVLMARPDGKLETPSSEM